MSAAPPPSSGMRARLTKRNVALAVLAPALVLLLSGTRAWASGRSTDPVLGASLVSATGGQLAPGVTALAAVAVAATIALLTGGRRIRVASAVLLVLASAGAAWLAIAVAVDPASSLAQVAAAGLGRTGGVETSADRSAWLWVGVVAAVLLLLASLLAAVASRGWGGLSGRFERPHAETTAAGSADTARGARRTAWDDLSDGIDPTEAVTDEHPVERRPGVPE